MKVAVTGASGFIGRHVTAHLAARGDTVMPVARPFIHDALVRTADRDGCAPEDFYSTTNQRTHVRVGGAWVLVGRGVAVIVGTRVAATEGITVRVGRGVAVAVGGRAVAVFVGVPVRRGVAVGDVVGIAVSVGGRSSRLRWVPASLAATRSTARARFDSYKSI